MEKDFDRWNEVKKVIHAKPDDFGVHERELWWVSLGVNIGVETDGKHETFERPVLVMRAFNREMVWIIPATTKTGDVRFYYKFLYGGRAYAVVLTQLRTVSTKRFIRKIGVMESIDFEKIRGRCRSFFG
ncbi:MAG: hypothetical protein Greene071436_90 [Parcubacteria group bacterium Greene0714_36]|nr:MAG: hypothetical protein Greene071436_90 [Parcubacteria group bacterium Greene0714_36]